MPRLAAMARSISATSYNITENIQIYGLVDNVFDSHYGLFGAFFNQDAAAEAGEADGLDDDFFENSSRTITPAPPVAAYGGIKVKY